MNNLRTRIRKSDTALDKTSDAKRLALEQINSPLAKYDSDNTLRCIICRTAIKSAVVWKAHVNSKQHKQKIEAAKQLKAGIGNGTPVANTPAAAAANNLANHTLSKTTAAATVLPTAISTRLTATSTQLSALSVAVTPAGAAKNSTSHTANPANAIERVSPAAAAAPQQPTAPPTIDEVLPEKFFDDPLKDAKVRNVEYKDDQTEEWERFQREIKEDIAKSNTIIAGEQDVATADRQIDEIDEQLQRWSRVIAMDKKIRAAMERQAVAMPLPTSGTSDADESGDENETMLDDFSDWRAKRF